MDLTFGEWLRRRRGGLGLTQAGFAKQLGCAPVTLRKFEAEERRPSAEMAARIASLVRMPPEQVDTFVRFARGEVRAGERLALAGVEPAHAPPAPDGASAITQLPIPPYALIGREELLQRASEAITSGQARVLTLAGPPGVGKTRLALELAHRLGPGFTAGAAFVELAAVQDAALVPAAVADALRVEDNTSADTTAAVLAALGTRHMLLVLDNFEHVIGAAPFVADLVARCRRLTCIVTSRERLRIRPEHTLRVSVLGVPKAATRRDVQAAAASRLFIARASQANAGWQPADADMAPIAELCAQLDGLPLALELLAARADLFTPVELLADLRRGLTALETGSRDSPERHRGLRKAVEWSLHLLSESHQALFAHLSLFVGGFDAAAAQAVFAHPPAHLLDLAQASLIQPVSAERWRLLEPIRQYGEEVLAQRGEADHEAARARHATHYAAVAEAARDGLLGVDAERWMARLEADHANVQAALQWSLRAKRPEIALGIGQGMFRFWHRRGMWREALDWLEQAMQMKGQERASFELRARAARAAGVMAQTLGMYDRAERHYQTSLELAERVEDDELIASALLGFGVVRKDQGRFDEALTLFDQAIPLEPEHALKFPWQNKADVLLRLGRFDESEALYRQAMALNMRINDEEGLAHTLRGLGEIAWRRGDAATAEQLLRENEIVCHKLKHERALSWTAQQLGNAARTRGDRHAAAECYADALARMDRMGDRWGLCEVLTECAQLALEAGHPDRAAQWIGMAQAGFRALGAKLTPYEAGLIAASLDACAEALGPEALELAMASGGRLWDTNGAAAVIAALRAIALTPR